MKFRIDLKIFLIIFLFFLTGQIESYFMMFIYILLHEIGHLLAGILLGMKPRIFEVIPQGFRMEFDLKAKDYNIKVLKGNLLEVKKILVALAGPLTNLIVIIIGAKISDNIFVQMDVVYTNLIIIIFNCIPIYPLDGGRILMSIIHILRGKRKSETIINIISLVVMICITFISSILIYTYQNIAIFIIIVFLWCIYILEDFRYKKRMKIYKLIDKTLEKKE